MKPATRRDEPREQADDTEHVGLLYGIRPWHIRVLCDNPWDGGRGFTPEQVGRFTVDQVFMLLCDRDYLLRDRATMETSQAVAEIVQSDGTVKGRSADGKPIVGSIRGYSKARELMDAKRKREEQERKEKPKRGRRK